MTDIHSADADETLDAEDESQSDNQVTENSVEALCNVIPLQQCSDDVSSSALPLPFDRPLSAQLACHTNTCLPPSSLVRIPFPLFCNPSVIISLNIIAFDNSQDSG